MLDDNIVGVIVAGNRQPGLHLRGTETSVGTRVPLHGCPLGVAAMLRVLLPWWIVHQCRWNRHVLHAQLIAIVARWGPAQGQ